MPKDYAKAFYKSREWNQAREYVLMRDRYLCTRCGDPAVEVHHVEMLNPENIWDPGISLNPDNLVSLCKKCHFLEHRHKRASATAEGFIFDENGNVVPVSE